jgi:ornithine decarboxylase
MGSYMQVNKNFFKKTRHLKTPFLVYDLKEIESNFQRISQAFPGLSIYYALKCNPDKAFVELLNRLGTGFEIASIAEARQLINQNVHPKNIICLHPIKSPEFLQYMAQHGIDILAVDCFEEVDKIARYAPASKLLIRVVVDNEGSGWPLNGKYGIESFEVPKLLEHILAKDLLPYGLTFHVGSQCVNEANWIKALQICQDIWEKSRRRGIELEFLSLGGGLPITYRKPIPELQRIGQLILKQIHGNFKTQRGLKVSIEPGRAIAATASVLVTTVFGLATRGQKQWAYIEVGTYNGLIEAIETEDRQFYPLKVEHMRRPQQVYNIGGPSCVSLDTPFEDVELPQLQLGDRLYILHTGAYSATCAAPFNGFPLPRRYYYHLL